MQLGDLPILAARIVAEPPAEIPMDRVLGLRLSTVPVAMTDTPSPIERVAIARFPRPAQWALDLLLSKMGVQILIQTG